MREPDRIHKALHMAKFGHVWIGCETTKFVMDVEEKFAMNRAEAEEYRDNISAAIAYFDRQRNDGKL